MQHHQLTPCERVHRTLAGSLLLAGLALPAMGTAATYYVDQAAANAADTNPGAEAAPFKTIQAAVAKVQPGDTVYVRNGTYRETVVWTNGNYEQPNARILLTAFPTHRQAIKGSETVTSRFAPVRVALRRNAGQLAKEAGMPHRCQGKGAGN